MGRRRLDLSGLSSGKPRLAAHREAQLKGGAAAQLGEHADRAAQAIDFVFDGVEADAAAREPRGLRHGGEAGREDQHQQRGVW